jgi:mycofactocin system glycosyltransferase
VSTAPPGQPPPPLPAGFGLALDPSVRRPRPEVLVGGSPIRVLRLRPAGVQQVEGWARGEPIGPSPGAQALARRLLDAGIAQPRPNRTRHPSPGDVTVVIPVRDRAAGLEATLSALGAESPVIVVDDGSTAPVQADGAEVIRRPSPGGPAAARNDGWRAAATDLIAFVDADCEPAQGWLATLLPHFADPAVAAVAPRIVSRAAGTPGWLATYEQRRSSLDLGPREAPVRPGTTVAYVPTAALTVRRQALLDACGFDETLRYGEDVDLVWRLGQRGWRVRYEPAAHASHPARTGLGPWLRQRHQYGRSAAPLAARHSRAVAPVAVSPWSAAAWGLLAAGYPLAGAGIAAATSVTLARRAGSDRATAAALARLAAAGHLRAGAALAGAIRRAWLPPALVAAGAFCRLGRRAPAVALGAVLTLPSVVEWVRERPPGLGPLRWSALTLADDLAYQSGVWAGVVETHSAAALLPNW